MGYVTKTAAGNWRANWRNVAGKQESLTFDTERAAKGHVAEMESAKNRGTYVSPQAGKTKFSRYAELWASSRNDEATTAARDASILRVHVVPAWGGMPLGKIDHSAVQAWVTKLSDGLSPATVRECRRLLSGVLALAVKDRIIADNPADGVKLPARRKTDRHDQTISKPELMTSLLPEIPLRYRALVALSAGTGLRWGECVGLSWDAVGLTGATVHVGRVAVEVAGTVSMKPYPKSRAGRRTVPLPGFVLALLQQHREQFAAGPNGVIFTNEAGTLLRRTSFRSHCWRPALVRAGLLGKVVQAGKQSWMATWNDADGNEVSREFRNRRAARAAVSRLAQGGLRFHDLRHSYATWLVSDGVPLNYVSRVMGHENISTTLDRYTHVVNDGGARVLKTFDDFLLTDPDQTDS
jgi:integrase